jgi:hypothetical protein
MYRRSIAIQRTPCRNSMHNDMAIDRFAERTHGLLRLEMATEETMNLTWVESASYIS